MGWYLARIDSKDSGMNLKVRGLRRTRALVVSSREGAHTNVFGSYIVCHLSAGAPSDREGSVSRCRTGSLLKTSISPYRCRARSTARRSERLIGVGHTFTNSDRALMSSMTRLPYQPVAIVKQLEVEMVVWIG